MTTTKRPTALVLSKAIVAMAEFIPTADLDEIRRTYHLTWHLAVLVQLRLADAKPHAYHRLQDLYRALDARREHLLAAKRSTQAGV